MKKICLLLLSIIAEANTCNAMAVKNTKVNPAMGVAVSKLQENRILFFDQKALYDTYTIGECPYRIACGKSLEYNDLIDNRNELNNNYEKLAENISKKYPNAIPSIFFQIGDAVDEQTQKKTEEMNLAKENYNADLAKVNDAISKVESRLLEISIEIGKRMRASAVLDISSCLYFDPADDITQEVFNTLNKEYNESESQKSTCNHCSVHCPHKH